LVLDQIDFKILIIGQLRCSVFSFKDAPYRHMPAVMHALISLTRSEVPWVSLDYQEPQHASLHHV